MHDSVPPLTINLAFTTADICSIQLYGSFKNIPEKDGKKKNDFEKVGVLTKPIKIYPESGQNAADFGSRKFFYMSFESEFPFSIKTSFGNMDQVIAN